MQLIGVDFTCAPRRAKPITVARGRLDGGVVVLERLDELHDFAAFESLLREPGPWLGGFDFPFGLPRELVETLDWPREWRALMQYYCGLPRAAISATFARFRAARPAGGKWAHRATDGPHAAASSPSMRDVNPPVAFMMHAGVARLIDAGVEIPRLARGDPGRIAVEAYPALLARECLGRRSYKSDERSRQTVEREEARAALVDWLCAGRWRRGLRLYASAAQRRALIADAGGDRLDAALCLLQAAWASTQPGCGLPTEVDPLEGWIVGA